MYPKQKAVILGLGNLLLGDEGFGIHALKTIQAKLSVSDEVEYIDGGVMGLELLPVVESCRYLLVLDAIDAKKPPGTLIELEKANIPLLGASHLSEHQIGFQEVLGMARWRDALPDYMHLIGVQPSSLVIGVDLSPEVEVRLLDVTLRAKKILMAWGFFAQDRS